MTKEKLIDMRKHPLVFLDLETTGVIPEEHEIIEIAYIIVDQKDLSIIKKGDYKIQPQHIETANQGSLELVGYFDRDWSGAISRTEALKIFMKDATDGIMIGQNIAFDWAFIRKALSDEKMEETMHYHRIDTMSVGFVLMHDEKKLKKFSLSEMTAFFGIKLENAHTAMDDVMATYEVYKKLLEYKKNHYS